MATKKTPTKKLTAKKPITTMAKASPMKQAKKPVVKTTSKPRVDDAEMKAYIKNKGAEKDKDVAAHKQSLLDRDYNPKTGKGGYTDAQVNLYKSILKKGDWSMGGANVNFRTSQGGITKFDKMYQKGSNKYMRDRVLTGDGKKEISNSGMEYGNSDGFPSQDYLKKSQAARMSDKQFRTQFVNDSIRTQGEKEKMLNRGRNFARIGALYGTQTSEIGSKVKAAINNKKTSEKVVNTKKADSTKVVVKKKTPLKQTSPKGLPPGTKTDGDMSKLDKYGRTPSEAKIHAERLSKMTPADHAEIKAAGLETKKKMEQRRMLGRDKPQRPTRGPIKMKKC